MSRTRAPRGRLPSLVFPSDLAGVLTQKPPARKAGRAAVRVAGRVLASTGDSFVLSDAFAQLTVRRADPSTRRRASVREGDWVVAEGRIARGELVSATVVQRLRSPVPRGDGEFARLVLRGCGPHIARRAQALAAIREFFGVRGFLEIETPLAVPAPGVDRNIQAVSAGPGWLITSPELEMKRLVVGGVPRQFQLARVSRAEETGALHEPEFTLLEWYRAFAEMADVMRDTEELVAHVTRALTKGTRVTTPDGQSIDVEPPFERVTVQQAFREHAGVADASELAATDEDRYFELLVDRVEPALARSARPIFLYEYPISEAGLARPLSDDPAYAERFELYVGNVELCNGYGELTDPVEQRRRFTLDQRRRRRERQTVYPLNEPFLKALEEGMPPSAGNALGVDRLVLLITGAARIQDVMAMPRERL